MARASGPIYWSQAELAEKINKQTAGVEAGLLDPGHRRIFTTNAGWTKSYRLPLRVRLIFEVAWFAVGHREGCQAALNLCPAIGKKIAVGYGRVNRWEIDEVEEDWSWFAPTEQGPILMATLPRGDWIPAGLIGSRIDFGACCPPYWHPERYTEVVTPC